MPEFALGRGKMILCLGNEEEEESEGGRKEDGVGVKFDAKDDVGVRVGVKVDDDITFTED